jgi:putative transposase
LLPEGKLTLIEPEHPHISITRQCDLVGLPRSSFDYSPQGESAENLHLMRLLDDHYTLTPYYGVRRMTAWLRSQGYHVHHKRGARLMHAMGIEAI